METMPHAEEPIDPTENRRFQEGRKRVADFVAK
jgi:hypothetical protein